MMTGSRASRVAMTPVERVGFLGNLSPRPGGRPPHATSTCAAPALRDDPSPEVILTVMDNLEVCAGCS